MARQQTKLRKLTIHFLIYCKFGFYFSFFERDVTRKRMKDLKKFLSAFISIKQKQKSVKIRSQCQSQRTDKKLNKVNGLTKAEQSQWFDNDLTNSKVNDKDNGRTKS